MGKWIKEQKQSQTATKTTAIKSTTVSCNFNISLLLHSTDPLLVKNPYITSRESTKCGLCSTIVHISWKKIIYKWIYIVQTAIQRVNCALIYIQNFQLLLKKVAPFYTFVHKCTSGWLPRWVSGKKNPPANAGDSRDAVSISGSGR